VAWRGYAVAVVWRVPGAAWGIDFTIGFVSVGYLKSLRFYVRAVRDAS